MTPQEIIRLLNIDPEDPPWDGDVREIQATVMVNRRPVRVRVLDVYSYCGWQMAKVQALQGEPFPYTNVWYQTWYSDTHNLHLVLLQDVTLVY